MISCLQMSLHFEQVGKPLGCPAWSDEDGPREAVGLGIWRRYLQAWLSRGVGVTHLQERKGWVVAATEPGLGLRGELVPSARLAWNLRAHQLTAFT